MADDAERPRLTGSVRAVLGDAAHERALMSGAAWRELCAALERAEERVLGVGVPDDERHRAEGYRYLGRLLAAGLRSCLTHDDPDYPVLARMIDDTAPWGLDHPDCLYLYGALRGGTSYTLSGNRGSANVLDVQVNAGHFSAGSVEAVETLAVLEGEALKTASDGSIRVRIGPHAEGPNALRTTSEVRFVLIRQYFADWESERPADLILERDDAVWPRPSPAPALVGRQLETLANWMDRGSALWESLSRRFLSMPDNSAVVHHVSGGGTHGALSGQHYAMGNFRCRPDEAVLMRFRAPACRHWNVSLANVYWEAVDYAGRQSSLNHVQAVPDRDGGFTCVIAHADPGHANWLDPGGNEAGTLALRLYGASTGPDITLERLPLSGVATTLGEDAPTIAPEERAAVLECRRHAIRRRFRT